MTKAVYLQSIGGASGDMLLAALLDAGLPISSLEGELGKLGVGGYRLSLAQDTRCEVRGAKLTVTLEENRRKLSPRQQLGLVAASGLSDRVKEQAARTLKRLWQAEGRVHGEAPEAVELEELGTVDTLVDVVGFAAGLELLGVAEVYAGPLVLGAGSPPRRAGGYANPAPATLELAADAGAPVAAELPMHQGVGELTTPTGAAIITTLAQFRRPAMAVKAVGVGLGGKDPAQFPNALRLWLGELTETAAAANEAAPLQAGLVLLETTMDDATGETLGYVQEGLLELGALDVWHTAVQMKKNRPGVILSALVAAELEAAAVALILRETPTLGVRRRGVERYAARREVVWLATDWGRCRVKLKRLAGEVVAAAPEYEDCRLIARAAGLPLQEVYRQAELEARRQGLVRAGIAKDGGRFQ